MSRTQIAETILQQLGGRRFITMTGTKHFTAGANYLSFQLPPNKSGANAMKIELTPMDVYTVTAYRVNLRAREPYRDIEKREDVYCDTLQQVFTSITGLETRL